MMRRIYLALAWSFVTKGRPSPACSEEEHGEHLLLLLTRRAGVGLSEAQTLGTIHGGGGGGGSNLRQRGTAVIISCPMSYTTCPSPLLVLFVWMVDLFAFHSWGMEYAITHFLL